LTLHVAQAIPDNFPRRRGTRCVTVDDAVILQWGQRKFTKTVPLDKGQNVAIMRSGAGFSKFVAFCHAMEPIVDKPILANVTIDCGNDEPSEELSDAPTSTAERRHPYLPNEVFETKQGTVNNNATQHAPTFDMDDAPTAYDTTKAQMMEWHQRLCHLPEAKMHEMAKRGELQSKFATCKLPFCPACHYSNASRRPWRTSAATSIPTRIANMPGDVVAIDQMVSPTAGLIAQMKGFLTRRRYVAATVFVDHYSNLSFTYFQKSLTADETLEARAAFERFASSHVVTVKHYQTDNGIFETDAFRAAIENAGQTISYAGVNAHHQNGHAEGKIRNLQSMGRSMLLHAAHQWPAAVTANLWPYAIRMANDALNTAPQVGTGLSPMERFAQVDVAPRIKYAHPFGCPVYVLDSRLQSA
jgi:hypothetical protein